jgi:hypothetical protein
MTTADKQSIVGKQSSVGVQINVCAKVNFGISPKPPNDWGFVQDEIP